MAPAPHPPEGSVRATPRNRVRHFVRELVQRPVARRDVPNRTRRLRRHRVEQGILQIALETALQTPAIDGRPDLRLRSPGLQVLAELIHELLRTSTFGRQACRIQVQPTEHPTGCNGCQQAVYIGAAAQVVQRTADVALVLVVVRRLVAAAFALGLLPGGVPRPGWSWMPGASRALPRVNAGLARRGTRATPAAVLHQAGLLCGDWLHFAKARYVKAPARAISPRSPFRSGRVRCPNRPDIDALRVAHGFESFRQYAACIYGLMRGLLTTSSSASSSSP